MVDIISIEYGSYIRHAFINQRITVIAWATPIVALTFRDKTRMNPDVMLDMSAQAILALLFPKSTLANHCLADVVLT
jgi:hypothetical protein